MGVDLVVRDLARLSGTRTVHGPHPRVQGKTARMRRPAGQMPEPMPQAEKGSGMNGTRITQTKIHEKLRSRQCRDGRATSLVGTVVVNTRSPHISLPRRPPCLSLPPSPPATHSTPRGINSERKRGSPSSINRNPPPLAVRLLNSSSTPQCSISSSGKDLTHQPDGVALCAASCPGLVGGAC
jgi:hypothetical protein